MPKLYPIAYEDIYKRLSANTSLSKVDIDIILLKLIKIITNDLNHNGACVVPYLGKFSLKRMPPRKRVIKDFTTGERTTVNIPAQDKLKFKINKAYSKIFK